MSDPVQEQLLGHLLGALEDSEQQEIATRLKNDAELRRELARVRGRLELLKLGRYDFAPPPGLAERTCRTVAAQAGSAVPVQRRPGSPEAAARFPSVAHEYAPPHGQAARFRWGDVAVAAAIFAAVALLLGPAVQSGRFNARVVACQDNLRHVGVGMTLYSQQHDGYFPCIPVQDKLAAAGINAPMLTRGGFVTDSRRFVCPGSPLADVEGYHVPSFDELQTASREKLDGLIRWMGGSYGHHLGYVRDGVYHGTKNLGRTHFGLVADVPGNDPSNGRQSPNHGGYGQNLLLEYGGVRFVTSPRPDPQVGDFFTNNHGLVAPGLDYNDSVIAPSAVRPMIILMSH
jgi:hypothetical protein